MIIIMSEGSSSGSLSLFKHAPLVASSFIALSLLLLPSEFTVQLGFFEAYFKLDALSIFFSSLLAFVSFYVSIYTIGYVSELKGKAHLALILTGVFILSMFFTIISNDIISFLFFWEIMSLSSFYLVISDEGKESSKVGFIYLLMTHLGTAFIILSFLLLYIKTSSMSFDSFRGSAELYIVLLALLGFSVKAGIVPFHVWLPYAHPVAPSNVSALMSGVMLNTAIYGMMRFLFEFSSSNFLVTSLLLIVFGCLSLVYGAIYSLTESSVKKFLAYSSIENMGLLVIGMGLANLGLYKGILPIYSTSKAFVLLHTLNHSLLKSSLFMGAGVVVKMTHEYSMNRLGGLSKASPLLFYLMLVSSVFISALPPSNVFFSELLLYKTLFLALNIKGDPSSYILILVLTLLALSGVFVGATFVKFIGVVFLGKSRGAKVSNKPSVAELFGIALPVALSVLIGIYPYPLLSILSNIYSLSLPDLNYLPFNLLFVSFILLLVISLAMRKNRARIYETWICGLDEENPSAQATTLSQTYSIRRLFSMFYSTVSEINFDAEMKKYFRNSILYKEELKDVFEEKIYKRLAGYILAISDQVRKILQTGNINLYISYIFLTLLLCFLIYIVLTGEKP